ncbi:MAG: anaerobic ribonucleoside-triphosphate reductase [Promethearchaeota archaeon]
MSQNRSYLKKLMPKVFRTEGDVVSFDPNIIEQSLIKETGLDKHIAGKITELVVRRIISSGIKFLSGPHIREIVCSILSEQHYEEERKLYTRIGMPLMDYEEILEKNFKSSLDEVVNPDKIHHIAANQLAEEYSLLRVLSDEEAHAHLYGDIYIHHLKYFDLRPYSEVWDARMILKYGLPPVKNWNFSSRLGPAKNLLDATYQLAQWLGFVQSEFSSEQKLEHLTVFLAPYVKGISDNEIANILRNFIYKIDQLTMITAKNTSKTSISCAPSITQPLWNLSAITPNGEESGVYGDYQVECLKIFEILSSIFMKGDYNNNCFLYPNHIVFFNDKLLQKYKESYFQVFNEALKTKNLYFINSCPNWVKKSYFEYGTKFNNHGILQKVSLNLPRIAYKEKDEDKFLENLGSLMRLTSGILKKKVDIIQKRLKTSHLPLCSNLNREFLFNLENQKLCIGFVGLSETLKLLTNLDFSELLNAFNLAQKIITEMKKFCIENSSELNPFCITGNSSNKALSRFARLDKKHFSKDAIPHFDGKNLVYSASYQLTKNLKIPLLERVNKHGIFHSIIQNDTIEQISLSKYNKELSNAQQIYDFLRRICETSQISYLKIIE